MGLGFWLLFSVGYHGHLHSAEGDQMFLFTCAYAREMILCPGGLANYLGAFFTQFYYHAWLGGGVIAGLLVLLCAGIGRFCKSDIALAIGTVPSLCYGVLLLSGWWTLAGLVALTALVWAASFIVRIRPLAARITVAAISLPFAWQLFVSARFFTYQNAPTGIWAAILGGTAAICLICAIIPRKRPETAIAAILYVILMGACAFAASRKYEKLDEEIDRYTYMVRQQDWDGVLSYAAGHKLNSPLSNNAVNLALLMKGRLGEDLFLYFQSGPRSLINFEERKISSEILFRLGFVNEAQHQAFEDMAGNPSRKRGVYHITRLLRFHSVDEGNAELCRRYAATLGRTLFYRHFDPSSDVEAQMEPAEDFFFNFNDFQSMLEVLSSQRPDNGRVREYLAASYLLRKDMKPFAARFGSEQQPPRSRREALQMLDALDGNEPSDELKQYVEAYNRARGKATGMNRYAGTYWYYYNFR